MILKFSVPLILQAVKHNSSEDESSASPHLDSSLAGPETRLPPVSDLDVMVGETDGQLSAFADDITGDAKVRWMTVD